MILTQLIAPIHPKSQNANPSMLQDLLHTPLFGSWNRQQSKWVTCCRDLNSWCAVGPGARRGINRLYGREVDQKPGLDGFWEFRASGEGGRDGLGLLEVFLAGLLVCRKHGNSRQTP